MCYTIYPRAQSESRLIKANDADRAIIPISAARALERESGNVSICCNCGAGARKSERYCHASGNYTSIASCRDARAVLYYGCTLRTVREKTA